MTTNIVQVEVRSVYGVTAVYPHNYAAKVFCSIAGTKTLTKAVMNDIKLLGYVVMQVHTGEDFL